MFKLHSFVATASLTAFAVLVAPACSTVCKVMTCEGSITTSTSINGKTKTHTAQFDDWDSFKVAWTESFAAWHQTREDLIQAYGAHAEAPLALGDVDPELAALQGDANLDFVSEAVGDHGRSPFSYVRTGQPAVDSFFAAAARHHALSQQAVKTTDALRSEALAVVGDDPAARDEALPQLVDRALKVVPDHGRIGQLKQAAKLLVKVAPRVRKGVAALRGKGGSLADQVPEGADHRQLLAQGLRQNTDLLGKSDEALDLAQKMLSAL